MAEPNKKSIIEIRRNEIKRLKEGIPSKGKGVTIGKRVGLRSFILHKPPKADRKKLPLLVFFHGSGDYSLLDDWVLKITSWIDLADKKGFYVLYPEAPGDIIDGRRVKGTSNVWNVDNPSDDIDFVYHTIDDIIFDFKIDPNRIYAVGFSTGGSFLTQAILELSDIFSAAANVMGGLARHGYIGGVIDDTIRRIPVAMWAGKDDNMTSFVEAAKRFLEDNGWNVSFNKVSKLSKHNWDKSLEAVIWDWLTENGISLDETGSPKKSHNLKIRTQKEKKAEKDEKSDDDILLDDDDSEDVEDLLKITGESEEEEEEEKEREEEEEKPKKHHHHHKH